MEKECVFCNILAGNIPADILYQDDRVFVLRDINPKAPTHLLVIPREHIPTVADLTDEQRDLAAHLIYVANELARKEGVAESGYRLILNCGRGGGQEVFHLHLHLLGGRQMTGTMG
jgi:histidine triad (HIT) family protein